MAFLTPPTLQPGDEVRVIAPSSGGAASARHVLELGLRRLRERFDLQPTVHPTAPLPIGGRVRVDPGERTITFP